MKTNVAPGDLWILLGGILLLIILLGLLLWWRAQSRSKPDGSGSRSLGAFRINPNSLNVHIVRDVQGQVLHVEHIREFRLAVDSGKARSLAAHYVNDNIVLFDGLLTLELDQPVGDTILLDQGLRLRFAAEKSIKETTVVSYAQTLHGIRVDRAGLSVVVNYHNAAQRRVTSAQSSLHRFSDALPVLTEADRLAALTALDELKEPAVLAQRLELDHGPSPFRVVGIHGEPRLLYHRYDPADRIGWNPAIVPRAERQPLISAPPYLSLRQVPEEIVAGQHYLVADVRFMLLPPEVKETHAGVNWRALIDIRTGHVLYIRPVVADCFNTIFPADGAEAISPCPGDLISAETKVFTLDPMTNRGIDPFDPATAPTDPAAYDALLDTFCVRVTLKNLKVTTPDQQLEGKWVMLEDTDAPIDRQATAERALSAGSTYQFDYPVCTGVDAFTAVNAYYHCDAMFRMLAQLGLLADLFPMCQTIRVDHMGLGGEVNARVFGTGDLTAADRIYFGGARRDAFLTHALDIGNAVDIRMVLHEFCHVLLLTSTHWPVLDFTHSAGDSLAAILNDPCSNLTDDRRYQTFPWIYAENPGSYERRQHGGTPRQCDGNGWCWGGQKDLDDRPPSSASGGYNQEQLLSTTLFRVYQAVGGDTRAVGGGDDTEQQKVRCFAARYLAYLIIRAIGALPYRDYTPTFTADAFATALMEADTGTPVFEDGVFGAIPGGTLHKVIRWSFEQQGLYQASITPGPVTAPAQPLVDVYIGPGRASYATTHSEFWETTDLWNCRSLTCATAGVHETAHAGQPNFAYLRIHNGGSDPATGVQVRGYYRRMGPDLAWEGEGVWTPMTPAVLTVPDSIAANEDSAPLGPFSWTPDALQNPAQPESWCWLFSVSADGDASNIDPNGSLPCKDTSTPLWRLVPFDNNLAAREVRAEASP